MTWLVACAWIDDTEFDARLDRDGDGERALQWGGADCDDGDPDVVYGGTYYADADADAYGDPETSVIACDEPDGMADNADDCDDADASVYPGAEEICDGADDDCNGVVDDIEGTHTFWSDGDGDGEGAGEPVESDVCPDEDGLVENDVDCDDQDATVTSADAADRWLDDDGDGFGDPAVEDTICPTDGWVDNGDDCDDDDDTIHPGVDEHCDDVDEDCDGTVDDDPVDPTDWYVDADGDGHGGTTTSAACDLPDGHTESSDDCDDTDAAVYPGAPEDCDTSVDANCDGSTGRVDRDGDGTIACEDCDDGDDRAHPGAVETCDGKDEDCDGLVDDDDPGVTGQEPAWPDGDGDSFGDDDGVESFCELPDGWVEVGGDCDDTSDDVNPDARERCDDASDFDCDGDDDDCTIALADEADAALRGVTAGDGAGSALAGLDDGAFAVGAAGADAVYIVGEPSTGSLSLADATWTGTSGDGSGTALAAIPDADGDRATDLVVGAPGGDTAYVLLDRSSGGRLAAADLVIAATSAAELGAAVAGGDLDGDGAGDAVVGAPATDTWLLGTEAGTVYGFSGVLVEGTYDETDADVTISSETASRRLGRSLAAADTDGDGADELFVGGVANTLNASGGVYVFVEPSGVLADTDADYTLDAATSGDDAGAVLAGGGDFDGDGYGDVLVGAADAGGEGVAYLVLGPVADDVALGSADGRYTGLATDDEAGAALACAGDLDEDGASDLLVGAPGAPAVYLFFGAAGAPGTVSVSEAASTWSPAASSDLTGGALAGTAGVFALVGAPGWTSETGAVYVVSGY